MDQENGERLLIQSVVDDYLDGVEQNPERIRFLCKLQDEDREELIAYNEILNYLETQEQGEQLWKFKRITGHEGPLESHHNSYKGSKYNVMIEWENGEITSEPLSNIATDDPVTCAIYARENGLLDLPGWKRFKSIAKKEKKYIRMVKQAKLRSFCTSKQYQYGVEIPRNYEDAMRLDRQNGNDLWSNAIKEERDSIASYKVFINYGNKPPAGYKRIRVHFVFAVKHDGRHKARLVADGHLTDVPLESVYSGVVSLRGICIIVFLAEHNELQLWATDVGNAYLEAETSEKLYIVAGSEFGKLQGSILVFHKALYGLRTSGKRWHERFADCLMDLGFKPCVAEPDIWLRLNDDVYEYIGVYVDDLAIAAKDPKAITDKLINHYGFKLKGTGPLTFHLGCDFIRDQDGIMCIKPTKYIAK
jgi:hypothetical protein